MSSRRPAWRLAVDAAAVYRLTRLVTKDDLTQPWREEVIATAYQQALPPHRFRVIAGRVARAGEPDAWQQEVAADQDPPKLATLITCRWCSGLWIGLGIVAVRRFRWWPAMADALALAAAAALIARLED